MVGGSCIWVYGLRVDQGGGSRAMLSPGKHAETGMGGYAGS